MIEKFLQTHPILWEDVYSSRRLYQRLVEAIRAGDVDVVRQGLVQDRRFLAKKFQETAEWISVTCEYGSVEVLDFFLEELKSILGELPCVARDHGIGLFGVVCRRFGVVGAKLWVTSLNWKSTEFENLFQKALTENDLALTEILLELGEPPNPQFIQQAFENRQFEILKLFLLRDSELTQNKKFHGDEFLLPSIIRGHVDLVLFLLTKTPLRLNVNLQSDSKETALSLAVRHGHLTVVEALLSHPQIQVGTPDVDGNTPLHHAVRATSGRISSAEILLRKGSHVNAENIQKQKPLHMAFTNRDLDVLKLLIRSGADIVPVDEKYDSLLWQAIHEDFFPFGLYLIQEKSHLAELNRRNKNGETSLMLAVRKHQKEIFSALLENQETDVNLVDKDGNTALHCAATVGEREAVRLLLHRGASVKSKNNIRKTPPDIARENDHPDLSQWMIKEHRRLKLEPFLKPLQERVHQLELQVEGLRGEEVLPGSEKLSVSDKKSSEEFSRQLQTVIRQQRTVFRILDENASRFVKKTAQFKFGRTFKSIDEVWGVAVVGEDRVAIGDCGLRVWDVGSGHCQTLCHDACCVGGVAVLADGRIVSGATDHRIRVWEVKPLRCSRILEGHLGPVDCIAVLPKDLLVSGSRDHTLRIWEVGTGRCLRTLADHNGAVFGVAVIHSGDIVSASEDGTLKVWNPSDGSLLRTFQGHCGTVWSVGVLPTGHLVSGSSDSTLKVWDLTTGQCLQTLSGHSDLVRAVAVMPNGQVVSASRDMTLKVWDTTSGQCVQTLERHSDYVTCVAATVSGLIVSGSKDKTVKVWEYDSPIMEYQKKVKTDITEQVPECNIN